MAGRIPQNFIDDLLNRVDIIDVVDGRVPLKKAGREYKACCPFHGEKTPSFTVSREKQFYHCFGCGAHGTAVGFLMEYDHMDFVEAVEELARMAGVEVPREEGGDARPRTRAEPDLYELLARAARFFADQLRTHPEAAQAVAYLKGRGLSGEIAKEFGIGYAPPGWDGLMRALGDAGPERLERAGLVIRNEGGRHYDRFRERVMFPIRDRRGRVIGFGGRVLGQGEPKYLNSPETPVFHKGRELYGLYEALRALRRIDRLLVVEGYMDVVALAQFDIRYAVATLGTATTADHLELIYKSVPEVLFCFDGDRAGRDAAWRALETALPFMGEGRQARFLFLPEGEDPDTLVRKEGRDGFEARLARAQPLSEFLLDQLKGRVDRGSVDGQARLIELARPLFAHLAKGPFRDLMLLRLADVAGLDARNLEQLFKGGVPPRGRTTASTAQAAAPQPPRRLPRNLATRAAALLLHRPELAAEAGSASRYAGLAIPGAPLFAELLESLQLQPQLTSAMLMERWRGREEEPLLRALFNDVQVSEGLDEEFRGAIAGLERLRRGARQAELLEKSKLGPLSGAEKEELRHLMRPLP